MLKICLSFPVPLRWIRSLKRHYSKVEGTRDHDLGVDLLTKQNGTNSKMARSPNLSRLLSLFLRRYFSVSAAVSHGD